MGQTNTYQNGVLVGSATYADAPETVAAQTRDASAASFRSDLTAQIVALRKVAYPGKYGATGLSQAQQNALFARVLLSLARMVVAEADPTALDATDA